MCGSNIPHMTPNITSSGTPIEFIHPGPVKITLPTLGTVVAQDDAVVFSELSVTGDTTVLGLTANGAITPIGGITVAAEYTASPRCCHTGGAPAQISTEGTNLSAVVTELYLAELFIPHNMTITGASVFWGDATEGNAKVMLFSSSGARVGISASTDVSGFTADSYGSRIPFATPVAAYGPAPYYVGVICDNSGNRINTHILGNFGAGKITGLVYATEAGYASVTVPTTFTTGLGPIATLY